MDDKLFQRLQDSCEQALKMEFCRYCGAGIGKHRREGEGTCPHCHHKGKDWDGYPCGADCQGACSKETGCYLLAENTELSSPSGV